MDKELDTYAHHEALHTTRITLELVNSEVLSHHAIKNDPGRRHLAQSAFENLWELYQLIGDEHLGETR